jgi:hypothetical protein
LRSKGHPKARDRAAGKAPGAAYPVVRRTRRHRRQELEGADGIRDADSLGVRRIPLRPRLRAAEPHGQSRGRSKCDDRSPAKHREFRSLGHRWLHMVRPPNTGSGLPVSLLLAEQILVEQASGASSSATPSSDVFDVTNPQSHYRGSPALREKC